MLWLLPSALAATHYVDNTVGFVDLTLSDEDTVVVRASYVPTAADAYTVIKGIDGLTIEAELPGDGTAQMPPIAFVDCDDLTLQDLDWTSWDTHTATQDFGGEPLCPLNQPCGVVIAGGVAVLGGIQIEGLPSGVGLAVVDAQVTLDKPTFAKNQGWPMYAWADWDGTLVVDLNEVTSSGNAWPIYVGNENFTGASASLSLDQGTFGNASGSDQAADLVLVGLQSATLDRVTVSGSSSDVSGGVWTSGSMELDSSVVTLSNSSFDSVAGYGAGALMVTGSAPEMNPLLELEQVAFSNIISEYGAALTVEEADLEARGVGFTTVGSSYGAGALQLRSSGARLSDFSISGATAQDGGGLAAFESDVVLNRGTICGTSAAEEGQGIYLSQGQLELNNVGLWAPEGPLVGLVQSPQVSVQFSSLATGNGSVLQGDAAVLKVHSSILDGPEFAYDGATPAELVLRNNLWGTPQVHPDDPTTPGQDSLFAEPGFHDAFGVASCVNLPKLGPDSPAVDAGWQETAETIDLDGSCPDMGAYGGPTPLGWDLVTQPAESTCSPPVDSGDTGETGLDTGDAVLSEHPLGVLGGGCGGSGAFAAALIGVGLGLRRRVDRSRAGA